MVWEFVDNMGRRKFQNDEIQTFILHNVRANPTDIVHLTAEKFEVSRQTAWKHVSILVDEGKIKARGDRNRRQYELTPLSILSKVYTITPELTEDIIWKENISAVYKNFPENVRKICDYGLSEMLNNAIEHSEGSEILLSIEVYPDIISIDIGDNGVGIFRKIQRECHLEDALHAILELSKGKLTTSPKNHSGEGIFFTSRMFDLFMITSYNLVYSHDKDGFDILLESEHDRNTLSGTQIFMEIATDSLRTTQEVFKDFSGIETMDFNRTIVPVFLTRYGDENLVSRSQARRLLARFDQFKEIVLDFSKVDSIGQAFADEIFRVFKNEHPSIHLYSINTSVEVQFMIDRAIQKRISDQGNTIYSQ